MLLFLAAVSFLCLVSAAAVIMQFRSDCHRDGGHVRRSGVVYECRERAR